MFAYVCYLNDGVKETVNAEDIKQFKPKSTTDFSSTQTYWILRKGRFVTGQILFMKETHEEIEQFLASGKRIRVPKLLDKIPPENKSVEKKEVKDNATAQKASIEEGKQTFLLDILKKRQTLKRKQPLCPPYSTTKREKHIEDDEITSESEDELIPKSKFNELEKRYKLLSRKYQEAIAEGKELRKLNVDLQTCLVAKILCGNNTSSTSSFLALPVTKENNTSTSSSFQSLPVTTENNTSTSSSFQSLPVTTGNNTSSTSSFQALPVTTGNNTSSTSSFQALPVTTGNNTLSTSSFQALSVTTGNNTLSTSSIQAFPVTTGLQVPNLSPFSTEKGSSVVTYQSSEQLSERHEIDIGDGVVIQSDKWKKIQANIKDSLFVKELAVCIWGTSILANRSIEGKSCPTTKSNPRPPLTPHKFRALKGCFEKWLEGKNLEKAELKARAGKLGHYVTEKIQDINKKIKTNK